MKSIAVLDFGGQYAHLIATRIRSLGIRADIYQPEGFCPEKYHELAGIIFSGGPHSVTEEDFLQVDFDVRSCKLPILGLCYGHQLLAKLLGGKVCRGQTREYGAASINIAGDDFLFNGLPQQQQVWMSHGDHVSELPAELRCTASSSDLQIAAFSSADGRIHGLQFHPEVSHTEYGQQIFERFLSICTPDRPWQPEAYHRNIIAKIREQAQDRKLLLLLSGGVDSLVALKLCLEAVGQDKVLPIHVDTGLMRANESADILAHLEKEGFSGVKLIEAQERFFTALKEVYEPEQKRAIIGRLFVEVVEEELETLNLDQNWSLVQGTIYPDHIESGGSKKSQKIKTHHNRVAEIQKLIDAGRVIEPLSDLYKDEVRRLGQCLGLPDSLINRHPFPGPGLGIRVLCSENEPLTSDWNREEEQLKSILENHELDGMILPVRSVGVQGDSRTYLHPAAIWPKTGVEIGSRQLLEVARTLINSLKTVNRVVLASIPLENNFFLEAAWVDETRVARLQQIDSIVHRHCAGQQEIWQMPVVSLPARTESQKDIFVLRPISSRDAMTAEVFMLPENIRRSLYQELFDDDKVGAILYDLTSKPPGTIEWE